MTLPHTDSISATGPSPSLLPGQNVEPGTFSTLVHQLEEEALQASTPTDIDIQSRLVNARLGIASGLFVALRVKHPATAEHCLRVALGCSSWAEHLSMDDRQRDELEIAALLHDVGKLGVPDHVLAKPSRLDNTEVQEMDKHRLYARGILTPFCTPELLDIVTYSLGWYDGRRHGFDLQEKRIPLGARVLAIVDAYDAMTTEHSYRPAMTRDRALTELFQNSGTQFDPELVKEFYSLLTNDRISMSVGVARRWLQQLHPESSNRWWQLEQLLVNSTMPMINDVFHQKLFETMQDGVVFIDRELRILLWNRAIERLTGISATEVRAKRWEPSLVNMFDEQGKPISSAECPLAHAVKSGVQTLRRLSIIDRNGRNLQVNAHMVPVIGRDGVSHGASFLIHGAAAQAGVELQVDTPSLSGKTDSVSPVANRSEFVRQLGKFVNRYVTQQVPFSLVTCDIDHLKRVNDAFGHQVGDELLAEFAESLQESTRPGDMVARYGGASFAILYTDCDSVSAAARAERIRADLSEQSQPKLSGKNLTASFGVTEVQGDDSGETMLRRADQALYEAKEAGRNQVSLLGNENGSGASEKNGTTWLSWFRKAAECDESGHRWIADVPLAVCAQKLRGFISDHQAVIQSIQENHVIMKIERGGVAVAGLGKSVPFMVELNLAETTLIPAGRNQGKAIRTLIDLSIRPIKTRDKSRRDIPQWIHRIEKNLKSYLMAEDYNPSDYRSASGEH